MVFLDGGGIHLCRETASHSREPRANAGHTYEVVGRVGFQEVREVLESVPEKYRTVLVLRDLENFSTAEIAGILDRKEATIRWRLAEARQRFQLLWQKRLDQDSRSPGLGQRSETVSVRSQRQ